MTIKTLAWIAALLFSFYGWGRAVRRAFRMPGGSWSVTIAIGLSAVVFLGGVLNLARLAWPWALTTLVIGGVVLSIAELKPQLSGIAGLRSVRLAAWARNNWPGITMAFLIAAILCFVAATLLPPRAYNFYDDFQKDFAHPVRMLQTGTLYGSPLSALGSETLGGQALLHALLLLSAPIACINGLDAVAGLFLCLVLAIGFAGGRRNLFPMALVCLIGVIFINPQVVNITALYMGSALMMTAIALTADVRELEADQTLPSPAAMGMLYAALISLKSTFVLFAGLHWAAVTVAVCTSAGLPRSRRWGTRSLLFTGIFLAPWILLHARHYLTGLISPVGPDTPLPLPIPTRPPQTVDFLSFSPTEFGSPMAHYTWLMATALIGGAIAVWAAARSAARFDDRRLRVSAHMTAAAGVTGLAAYLLIILVFGPLHAGYVHALRYFTPFAIGIAPAVFGWSAFQLARSTPPRIIRMALPLVAAAAPVLAFWPSLYFRAEQAVDWGNVLAFTYFSRKAPYLEYNWEVLNGVVPQTVARVQSVVPPGEPIIAWINAPFYLDYARNPIVDVDSAGLATDWAKMPQAGYVAWEYKGLATPSLQLWVTQAIGPGAHQRKTALRAIVFGRSLDRLVTHRPLLYEDEHFVVFRLDDPSH